MARTQKISKVKNKPPAKMRVISIFLFAIMVLISIGSLAPWRKIGLLMIFGYWFVDSVGKGWLSKRDSETLRFIYFSIFIIPMLYFLVFKIAGRDVFSADLMLIALTALVAYLFRLSLTVDYGTSMIFGPVQNPTEKARAKFRKTSFKALVSAFGITALAMSSLWGGDAFFNRSVSAHIFATILVVLTFCGLVLNRIKFNKHQAAKQGGAK